MRTKRIFSALLAGMICMGITACDTPTDTGKPSDETPHGTYENRMIVKTVGIDTSPMTDGETLFHRNTENALVKMTNENGIWKTEPVITEQMLHYTAMWNGDFLLYLTETGSEIPAWYVYDTETAACEPLAISLSDAAAEAMRDVSGICVIGDDLFIMHSYWQGISRIDLATGECVNFDS